MHGGEKDREEIGYSSFEDKSSDKEECEIDYNI